MLKQVQELNDETTHSIYAYHVFLFVIFDDFVDNLHQLRRSHRLHQFMGACICNGLASGRAHFFLYFALSPKADTKNITIVLCSKQPAHKLEKSSNGNQLSYLLASHSVFTCPSIRKY